MSLSFLDALNDVQRAAVTAVEGPVLIVAGAGSGKTRVLTYRVAYLLAQGTSPRNILALTFTNKAAGEMKERIADLVGVDRARSLWMGTFHSLFSRILRREASSLGYTKDFTIYDADDSVALIRSTMAEFGISSQDYSPKMIHHRISSAKNAMIHPGLYRSRAANALEERIALLYENYERRLRASNAMDFDDLLVRTIDLFEKFPDVLARYREQFRYVMIDEYQDTNRAQYLAVHLLAGPRGNICVVGDDAQSIYRFRGADIRNILEFERDYPGHKTFRLEQNYRSTKRILAVADGVIRNNRHRIVKELWTENDQGDPVAVRTSRDERDEGEDVRQIIQSHVTRGVPLSQIAVLYRTNSQSLSVEDALRRASIPYGLVGGVAFYRRKEVKDALAYLRLAVNPRDDEAFVRAVNTPARGIGETSVKRIRAYAEARGIPLFDAARAAGAIDALAPRVAKALVQFALLFEPFRTDAVSADWSEAVSQLLSNSGLLESHRSEGTPDSVARWDNVQRILSHVAEFAEHNPDGGLTEYLQEVSLVSDVDSYDPSAGRVTLMTVHAAKGLEFDVVVVVGMEEGLFPVGSAAQDRDDLEEERRLFYVAVTRARRRLYLTNCERRYRFGELSYPTPSRFLQEIDDEHLEYSSTSPRKPPVGPRSQTTPSVQRPRPRRSVPDMEVDEYSQVVPELRAGVQVIHPTFGAGRVEAVVGAGDRTTLTVRFDRVGRKQLMLRFANLRVLGSS